MLREVFKNLAVMMSTAVAIPYTIAILCNVLYGWPMSRERLKDSLSVKKVCALNFAVIQQMKLLKYVALYIRWKCFYKYFDSSHLVKDIPFGRNDKNLDVYVPAGRHRQEMPKPVLIYIFGGGWSSGDKSMCGLVCSQIANQLAAVVCCPNYSLYPQGCVDDMIQDVVDSISWVHNNIHTYGGDKEKIMLVGHSAGAHLSVMAVLELLHDQLMAGREDLPHVEALDNSTFHFEMMSQPLEGKDDIEASDSFCIVNSINMNDMGHEPMDVDTPESDSGQGLGHIAATETQSSHIPMEPGGDDDCSDNDSVVAVRPKDSDTGPTLSDMCKSIKAIIGLAGVYHIKDHYEHEKLRGLEDVSCMHRAMYGDDHFGRFSPTVIIMSMKRNIKLPKMVLVHGTEDYVVPLVSSTKFGEALSDIFADVTVRVIPDCDHYSIFLDLMSQDRRLHDVIMGIILETARRVF